MDNLSIDEIRKRFEFAKGLDDVFDTFQQALAQEIGDLELYTTLFWNKTLSPDEVAMFAEQLVKKFPDLAYAVYLWMGEMSALTQGSRDNFERALTYYRKASAQKPSALDPYLNAVACYDPDVRIPPAQRLIEFLKSGIGDVEDPIVLFNHLAYLYEQLGNDEMTQYYKRRAGGAPEIS